MGQGVEEGTEEMGMGGKGERGEMEMEMEDPDMRVMLLMMIVQVSGLMDRSGAFQTGLLATQMAAPCPMLAPAGTTMPSVRAIGYEQHAMIGRARDWCRVQ